MTHFEEMSDHHYHHVTQQDEVTHAEDLTHPEVTLEGEQPATSAPARRPGGISPFFNRRRRPGKGQQQQQQQKQQAPEEEAAPGIMMD